jgi:pilus assembly protein Flp/PilA
MYVRNDRIDPKDFLGFVRGGGFETRSQFSTWSEETAGGLKMRNLTKKLVTFLKKEDGPTAVEYAVMLALIIVVCLIAITQLGVQANSTFSNVGTKLQAATSGS